MKTPLVQTALVAGLGLALACAQAFAQKAPEHDLDYDHQETWHGVLDHAQSPVNIVTTSAAKADTEESGALFIESKRAPGKVTDTGHAIQVNTDVAEALIRGRHFKLTQFHFHTPSEHTIDGRSYPLEGHFVFRAQDGRLLVVGVMYEEGQANPAIEPVLEQLRHKGTQQAEVDVASLMPDDKSYYHYLGSLTTPPLTENVEWYVLAKPMQLSHKEIEELHARYPHNNRKVQPMNDRPLVYFQQ
jgi:carbonic anhydrase